MKKCPYCNEEIQSDAVKCRYCREWLDAKPTAVESDRAYSQPWKFLPWNWKSFITAAIITAFIVALTFAALEEKPPKNIYWTVMWLYLSIEAWKYWGWKVLLPYPLYLLIVVICGLVMKGMGIKFLSGTTMIVVFILNIGGLAAFYLLLCKTYTFDSQKVHELKYRWRIDPETLWQGLIVVAFVIFIIVASYLVVPQESNAPVRLPPGERLATGPAPAPTPEPETKKEAAKEEEKPKKETGSQEIMITGPSNAFSHTEIVKTGQPAWENVGTKENPKWVKTGKDWEWVNSPSVFPAANATREAPGRPPTPAPAPGMEAYPTSVHYFLWYIDASALCESDACSDQRITEYLDNAIRLKPDFAEAYLVRGTSYHYRGQYRAAIEDFDQAIRLRPNRALDLAMAYHNRGSSYHSLGQYQQAISDYNEAIRLKPDFAEAHNNRQDAYARLRELFSPAPMWK